MKHHSLGGVIVIVSQLGKWPKVIGRISRRQAANRISKPPNRSATVFKIFSMVCLILGSLYLPSSVLAPAHAGGFTGDARDPAPERINAPLGAPRAADDSHFIADTGGDLDLYLFRDDVPDGRLRFNIPITRYYFNTLDSNIAFDSNGFLTPGARDHVVSKGALPSSVRLELRVYDVDEDAEWCPERDLVFVNGQPLVQSGVQARLSGANDTWSVISFPVPVGLLKFPQATGSGAAPTPAQNEIAIQIDANLCNSNGLPAWAVTVDYGMLEILSPIRPVIFAHGWTGTTQSFTPIEDRLVSDAIPSAGQVDLQEGIFPIPLTADWLRQSIEAASLEFGVDKVNLFAHSKGGLVSRRALYDAATAAKVEHFLTFDTPNHGTLWAESIEAMLLICSVKYPFDPLKSALCFSATQEFRRDAVRSDFNYHGCVWLPLVGWFNCHPTYIQQAGVDYLSFAATAGLPVVYPHQSATYPWDADAIPFPDTMSVNASFSDSHSGIIDDLQAYQCAIHLLDSTRYSCPASGITRPEAPSAAPPPDRVILSERGSLAGAGTDSTTVQVDAGTQLIFEAYAGKDFTFNLLEPGGREITSIEAGIDPFITHTLTTEGGLWLRQYQIKDPRSGTWEARVQSSAALEFALLGRSDAPVDLQAGLDHTGYRPGETIIAQAALVQGSSALTGGSISGDLLLPDQSTLPVSFNDQGIDGDPTAGDGMFTAQFTAPSVHGNLVLGIQASQATIYREKEILFPVAAQTATLQSVTDEWREDSDSNGLYDFLFINVAVDILQAGYFDLRATLQDSTGSQIQSSLTTSRSDDPNELPVGTHIFTLRFDGREISGHGADGPYTLTGLSLMDTGEQILEVDTAQNFYTTGAYLASQFEQPLVRMEGGSESVADTDADGRIDALTIHLQIGVLPAGTYSVNGRLVDGAGGEIAWGSSHFSAGASGVYAIDLPFDGNTIGNHGVDGPYQLQDLSVFNNEGTASASFAQVYTTQSYHFTEFESGYYRLYLPTTLHGKSTPTTGLRIYGRVTNQVVAAAGIPVELRFFNGSEWSTYHTATSNATGDFEFTDLPELAAGEVYYVRWSNPTNDPTRLGFWACDQIDSTTTDPAAFRCDFDIQGISLLSPTDQSTISLPSTFSWSRRALASDDYELNLFDPDDYDPWWWTLPLGYTGNYQLGGLPQGFTTGVLYGWYVWVYSANGYGWSYYYHRVVFSGSGQVVEVSPPDPLPKEKMLEFERSPLIQPR